MRAQRFARWFGPAGRVAAPLATQLTTAALGSSNPVAVQCPVATTASRGFMSVTLLLAAPKGGQPKKKTSAPKAKAKVPATKSSSSKPAPAAKTASKTKNAAPEKPAKRSAKVAATEKPPEPAVSTDADATRPKRSRRPRKPRKSKKDAEAPAKRLLVKASRVSQSQLETATYTPMEREGLSEYVMRRTEEQKKARVAQLKAEAKDPTVTPLTPRATEKARVAMRQLMQHHFAAEEIDKKRKAREHATLQVAVDTRRREMLSRMGVSDVDHTGAISRAVDRAGADYGDGRSLSIDGSGDDTSLVDAAVQASRASSAEEGEEDAGNGGGSNATVDVEDEEDMPAFDESETSESASLEIDDVIARAEGRVGYKAPPPSPPQPEAAVEEAASTPSAAEKTSDEQAEERPAASSSSDHANSASAAESETA